MPAAFSTDLIAGIVSFLLTLMILSYLIGDNPAFRVAVYLFVGVAAGYAAAITWWQVLAPRVMLPLFGGSLGERILALIAFVLGASLLLKFSPRTARLGNPALAFLVGVGAAVALAGAVTGTLFPQTLAFTNSFAPSRAGLALVISLIFGILMVIGTVTTLVYFHFGARSTPAGPQRGKFVVVLSWIGQIFIAITLGSLFAGVLTAAIMALIERLNFLWTFLGQFL